MSGRRKTVLAFGVTVASTLVASFASAYAAAQDRRVGVNEAMRQAPGLPIHGRPVDYAYAAPGVLGSVARAVASLATCLGIAAPVTLGLDYIAAGSQTLRRLRATETEHYLHTVELICDKRILEDRRAGRLRAIPVSEVSQRAMLRWLIQKRRVARMVGPCSPAAWWDGIATTYEHHGRTITVVDRRSEDSSRELHDFRRVNVNRVISALLAPLNGDLKSLQVARNAAARATNFASGESDIGDHADAVYPLLLAHWAEGQRLSNGLMPDFQGRQ